MIQIMSLFINFIFITREPEYDYKQVQHFVAVWKDTLSEKKKTGIE